jgi:hypothetical protein
MREGCKSSGASEARGSGAGGAARMSDFLTGVSWHREGGESDRWGPVDRETRERRPAREGVFPVKTRPTRGLDGPAGTISACGDGAASGLAGPEAERAARLAGPKARKNDF